MRKRFCVIVVCAGARSGSELLHMKERDVLARVLLPKGRAGHVVSIAGASHGSYGVPQVRAELHAEGTAIDRRRVAHAIRQVKQRGVSCRRFPIPAQGELSREFVLDRGGRDALRSGARASASAAIARDQRTRFMPDALAWR